MPIVDQSEREQIRTALDKTFVVEAAAGTGKTTELVNRMIAVLASGITTVDRIVAVTFTEKAAGELKLRLRAGLDKERAATKIGSERYHNLENALARLEEAHSGTIHGFCSELLRERPMQAGVDPESSAMDENEASRLYGRVFSVWLQEKLENPTEGIRRSLRRSSQGGPTERLRQAGWELTNWRDFPGLWMRPVFNRCEDIDRMIDNLKRFVALTANPTNSRHPLYTDTWQARQLLSDIVGRERTRPRDYDQLEAELVNLAHTRDFCKLWRTGYGQTFSQTVSKKEVLDARADLITALRQFADAADSDLAALLHSELQECISRYESQKRKLTKLDFVDLLLRTRALVRDCFDVRRELQTRFTHIFVDEFQDTDPLQAEILLLLSADDPGESDWRNIKPVSGKLFIVGDPKQSIFRFRRADVGLYQEVKDMLVKRGASVLHLRTSFRAVPSIQNAINSAFKPVMVRDAATCQAEYVALAPHRSEDRSQPSLVVLSVPRPYGNYGRVTETAILSSLPDATGAFVEWLINGSGWTVTERGGNDRVAIAPRHICILFRRFENFGVDMAKPYADALQARGIAHVLVGGKSFHQREEVGAIRTALSAIEWPDDELSIFATLRGSFFAIPDHLLLIYRHEFRTLHPFRIPEVIDSELAPISQALKLLADLHRSRNYRPAAQTISMLLTETRAHAGFAMRPSGEQVLANVLHVADLARSYESGGGVSFRGFVEQLIDEAESGESPDASIYEEGMEGVRLTTVHRAKGLEFPIVILADITAKLAARSAARYIDAEKNLCVVRLAGWQPRELITHEQEELARERAEGIRISYVAATRSRDLLVIPAVGDDATGQGPLNATDWWVKPLFSAVYPSPQGRRKPARAENCPGFGKDSVIRPDDLPGPGVDNVCPGSFEFGAGGTSYSVVWWDPRRLSLGRTRQFSLRQEQLLHRGDAKVVEGDLEHYQTWRQERDATVQRGSEPSFNIASATECARGSSDRTDCVEVIDWVKAGRRAAGIRFGALVHATLSVIPMGATSVEVRSAAELQARILAATEEEKMSAIEIVEHVLLSDLWQRARNAAQKQKCRRETPITLVQDGQIIEGVVDLAFEENNRWIVVDFKTDKELENALARYRNQISIYVEAISEATGKETAAYILRI